MASANDKQILFISRTRQLATQYRNLIGDMTKITKEWSALYNTLLAEEDFESGNTAVIPSGDPAERLTSLTTVVGNMETIIATYDAGIDTNFERITA